MKRSFCRISASLVLILLLLPVLAFATQEVNKTTPLGVNSLGKMKPNGEYVIEVFKDDKWQEAGSLAFDQFFREKTINIVSPANEGPVRIKITQKGGEAAHIDSVFLGNMPPVEVKGKDNPLIMKKISQKDFDVIDAFGKEFELAFNNTEKTSAISITARIEAERISETPFQYPLANLYKNIDSKAEFYTYKLNSNLVASTGNNAGPFFREYSVTGSGHPSGYTYGWVSNDEKNLYVKIDFTPDNTMDGPKDYAKVNVKTEAGIKEFKVSVPETKWGKPDFTYTDKVAYQHKVYDFAIPLNEIGIKDAKKADEIKLDLAFAAYGTASPAGGDFNSASNTYLVVYNRSGDIYGWLVDSSGSPVGTEITISAATNSQNQPSVAYNSSSNQYLVVWYDYRTGDADIYGQLVNSNGTLSGPELAISTATNSQYLPSVTYNSSSNQYLVAWYDYRTGTNWDIYGQLINANGTLSGSNFAISTVANDQYSPSVAYNSSTNQYLVAWQDNRGDSGIYGQLINANGTLSGSELAISTASGGQYIPSVTYNSSTNQYFVVWEDNRSGSDIYGQLINANGTLSGSELAISTAANSQYQPSVAYNSSTNQYLVVWYDYRSGTGSDIYGQYLASAGTLTGEDFLIVSNAYAPHVMANTNIGNYLVAYWNGEGYAWVIVGEPVVCTPPPSDMVSWWGGDNNALDMVGANNGTLIGDTTYETGKVGQAFSFDGAGDYVTASTNNLPLGNSPRTITAWINAGTGNTWGGIFHYGQGDCNGRMFGLGKQSGRLTFWGGCADFVSDLVIPENQWTFVAVIYNGSQITLWMNDQSQTSNHSLNTQNSNLWIGGETVNNGSSFRSYYQGLIDEVDIYTRALTDEEITAIYNAGSAGKCRSCVEPPSDMIAWWDGEGDANDIIGTNHGTLQNGATFATGKVGQTFSLNGSNYVEVPDQPILRPSLFTVDAWVFPTVISGNHNVVFKGDHEYLLQLRNGKVLFGSRSATGAYAEYQGSLSVPVNTWSHVAITHDGITKRIYVNGALDPVTQNQVGHYTINMGTLKIGTHNSISEFFNGSIDEIEIFNRALSADEIAAIYNAGSAGKCVTDTTPAQFTFTDQTDVGLNTVVESNTITVSSINSETFIGITDCTGTNCEYRINSGSWTSSDGTVNNGDTVQVRQTSSWSYSATTNLTLYLGPVFDVFSVTTTEVPPGPLPDLTGDWYEPLTEKCKEKKEGLVCKVKGKLIIRNIGDLDAEYVVFRFYLSDDDSYGVGDILLKADFMYNVNVGKDYKKSFNLTLPVGMSFEGRYIIVYIDAESATVESDESNNFVVYGEASS